MKAYALAIVASLIVLLIILVTAQPAVLIEQSHPTNQLCQPSYITEHSRWPTLSWRWVCHPVGQGDR